MQGTRSGTIPPAGGVRRRTRCARKRAARRGWTLLEVSIGIVLLTIGLLASSRAILRSTEVNETVREVAVATSAGRRMIETLHATPLEQVFALYNATDADDPGGGVVAPGASFAVDGLTVREDDADGMVGEILFPTAAGGAVLREDVDEPLLGMPRDLDGDGVIDADDHSNDYGILPVLIRLRWTGAAGASSLEFKTVLARL